jgi:cephalosporin hydroxylase
MATEPLAADALSSAMLTLAVGGDGPLAELWTQRVAQHFDDSYAGVQISKFPEDLRTYERVLWKRAANVVVEVGVQFGGSALWLRDRLFDNLRYRGGPAPIVIGVDVDLEPARRNYAELPAEATAGIELIEGDIGDPEVVQRVRALVPSDAEVFVIEDAQHDAETTAAALHALAPMIRAGGYLMVEDTCVDYETLRATDAWPRGCGTALARWLEDDPLGRRFTRRPDMQPYGLTCHPGGLVQRLPDPV